MQSSDFKTILITGASSGIGLELARVCPEKGHHLVLIRRHAGRLKDAATELAAHGVKVHTIRKDLSEPEAADAVLKELTRKKISVDALVNNAGFGDHGAFEKSDWEKVSMMIMTNVHALTHLTRLVLPSMRAHGRGIIVNIGSTAGLQPGPYMAVYYATKAFVNHFSEALDYELRGSGIRVTCILPGATSSGFQEAASLNGSLIDRLAKLATSRQVAEFTYAKMMAGRRFAIHGVFNRILAFSLRLTPRFLVTFMAAKINGEGL